MSKETEEVARRRAELIFQVRTKQISAKEAAHQLGIARQKYHVWERKALEAMLAALENKEPGRPPKPPADTEKIRLEKKVAELEKKLELMAEAHELKGLLAELQREETPRNPKETRAKPPKKKP